MFARNVSLSATTTQESVPVRRKMRLSDAIRSVFGKPARREAHDAIAVRGEGHWPVKGVCADWQLEEPEMADGVPVSVSIQQTR